MIMGILIVKGFIDLLKKMEKLTNAGNDSTLFVLNPTPAAADTEQSKMHYSIGYTFIMPEIVSAEAGSTGFRVIVRNGFKNAAGTYIMAPVDSFTVTTANQDSVLSTAISIPGGKFFDVLVRTITGTAFSQATTFRLWFRRYR